MDRAEGAMSRVDRVLAAYALSRPTVVERFEANYRNDNWLIEDGESRRYVLRRHRQHRQARRVTFQLSFQQHLHRHGFPTPQVIETREGATCVVGGDGLPWSLLTYVDGTFYEFDRMGHVVEAARRLAQFHTLAETFGGEDVRVGYAPPIREWGIDTEDDFQVLKGLFAESAFDEELAYVWDWWQSVLAEWPLRRVDALPIGWVHGDYHGRNMVFVEDEMRALFDFDDLNRGPLVFDVARGVHMFGRDCVAK
ncbi:MAG: phosphotransferase enzyme family protein [bacterium]